MKKFFYIIAGIILNMMGSALLFAQEAAKEITKETNPLAYIGLALSIGIPAIGTAWAQAKIGSAGAGTIAERPEMAVWILILVAIPETVVILGFVIAFMLLMKI
jgi:V/A-type H+-transporting ATPase subunit K